MTGRLRHLARSIRAATLFAPPLALLGWLALLAVTYNMPTFGMDPTVIVGPGCPPDRQRGYQAVPGGGDDRWQADVGGYTGNGCDGRILYASAADPVSGATGGAPGGQDKFVWRVNFPDGIADDTYWCAFEVHIPNSVRAAGVATYRVYQDPDARSRSVPLVEFTLNQAKHRDSWVRTEGFTTLGTMATLDLVLIASGRATGGGSVAADAAFVGCTDNLLTQ